MLQTGTAQQPARDGLVRSASPARPPALLYPERPHRALPAVPGPEGGPEECTLSLSTPGLGVGVPSGLPPPGVASTGSDFREKPKPPPNQAQFLCGQH